MLCSTVGGVELVVDEGGSIVVDAQGVVLVGCEGFEGGVWRVLSAARHPEGIAQHVVFKL